MSETCPVCVQAGAHSDDCPMPEMYRLMRMCVREMLTEIGATALVDARHMPTLTEAREWEATSSGPFRATWGGLAEWIEEESRANAARPQRLTWQESDGV